MPDALSGPVNDDLTAKEQIADYDARSATPPPSAKPAHSRRIRPALQRSLGLQKISRE
jgi:hypothetical protein